MIQTLLTAEEFFQVHGHERMELVKGQIVRLDMPDAEHGYIGMNVGALLSVFVKSNQLGRVMGLDTFIRVKKDPDTIRGADILFISYERLPKEVPLPKGFLTIAPELVIEVASPSDRWSRLLTKAGEYLEAGVKLVIGLDPTHMTATLFREAEFPQTLDNGDILTIPDILPGFSTPVRQFFE